MHLWDVGCRLYCDAIVEQASCIVVSPRTTNNVAIAMLFLFRAGAVHGAGHVQLLGRARAHRDCLPSAQRRSRSAGSNNRSPVLACHTTHRERALKYARATHSHSPSTTTVASTSTSAAVLTISPKPTTAYAHAHAPAARTRYSHAPAHVLLVFDCLDCKAPAKVHRSWHRAHERSHACGQGAEAMYQRVALSRGSNWEVCACVRSRV